MKTEVARAASLLGLGAALLLTVGLARAETARADTRSSGVDGDTLLARCTSRKPGLVMGCTAYVDGVADTVAVYQGAAKAAGDSRAENRICIPADVRGTQMRDTVVTWLRNHADQRHRPSANLVVHVLRETWPCH